MIIKQISVSNTLRNFNYIIACPVTGDACVIDPLDVDQCLDYARKENLKISIIINTHEHADHTAGNKDLVKATHAKVYAHHLAAGLIPNMTHELYHNTSLSIGTSVRLNTLDTPGHTRSHVCLIAKGQDETVTALFSGDTLFNAGVGNCHHGGHAPTLFHTINEQIKALPETTKIYPGHDYIRNNLQFTIKQEPSNGYASKLLKQLQESNSQDPYITTIREEKKMNTFLRLQQPELIDSLQKQYGSILEDSSEKSIFLKLRELRDRW